jgi:HD-GYP domain-containing protein (c-di-GMP phosphodiesterase class II)
MAPESLRAKYNQGVAMWCRESDAYLMRRMLTVSLNRTLSDVNLAPRERSNEAYKITAGVLVGTFAKTSNLVDFEEVNLVTETIDMLTRVLAVDDESLWSMVAAMQRNSETHHHAINTAVYSLALAKRHGITDFDRLRDIGRGAILMDLGLTTVPARTLEKPPAERDALEVRAIKNHPQAGYAIVMRATGESPSYAHIILEHHERLDGSGFPAGRRAGQLSTDSQLVAITEHFDALTNTGAPSFEALRDMRFGNPDGFNPDILTEFIALLGGWNGIRADTAAVVGK